MRISTPYFALFAILLLSHVAIGQWRGIHQNSDSTNTITGVSFYTRNEGFVAFDKYAGYTQDSGHTFIQRPVTVANVDYNGYGNINVTFGFLPNGVKAFNKDTLLLFGHYALEPSILRSVNGGLNWKLVYWAPLHPGDIYAQPFMEMLFPQNSAIGFAVCGDRVLKSTDRGNTWQISLNQYDQGLKDIDFLDTQNGFALAPGGLWKTQNGGTFWTQMNAPGSSLQRLDFISPTIGYVVNAGYVYKSTNGGVGWTKKNDEPNLIFPEDVYFINESEGYATVKPFAILKTQNEGKIWEVMQGSTDFSYLGYGFNSLFFFNNQLAWAAGDRGYLVKTDNGGGGTYPKSSFVFKTDQLCTNNIILLENQSVPSYSHKWFRNGVQFSTAYNTSYTPGLTQDTIRLIVTSAYGSDTSEKIVPYTSTAGFTFQSIPRDTNLCSGFGQNFYLDIPNSDPNTLYYICTESGNPCYINGYGNGGLLTLVTNIYATDTITVTLRVFAVRNTFCGQQTSIKYYRVHVAPFTIPITASADTMCPQKTGYVRVQNSRIDYLYWADSSFPKVQGTGGAILLPVNTSAAIRNGWFDQENLIPYFDFGIRVSYIPYQCFSPYPSKEIRVIGRLSKAKFEMVGKEYFIGDPLRFRNLSKYATTYQWVFDTGASSATSTQKEPQGISFSSAGQKLAMMYSYSLEGCVDSANFAVEVFNNSAPSATQMLCVSDSITSQSYMANRDLFEDEYGNYYLTGGFKPFNTPGFGPGNGNGWYLMKFNKNKQIEWKFEQKSVDAYTGIPGASHHIIMENVVADRFGYTYVYGHTLQNTYIRDSNGTNYPISRFGSVLIKLKPNGKILWVKPFYHNAINAITNYTGGTLLKGRNDDLYIITHVIKGLNTFYMGVNQILYAPTQTGLILHLDKNGTILDKKSFPAQYHPINDGYGDVEYDFLPKSVWSGGRIAIYANLDPTEISGGQIDDAQVQFNVNDIRSAILFYDTATKRIQSVKPIYQIDKTGKKITVDALSMAVDSSGNYYAGFLFDAPLRKNTHGESIWQYIYQYDTLKPKGAIIAFDANGNLIWRKTAAGFRPNNLQAFNNKVFATGVNYPRKGYYDPWIFYYPNPSGLDSSVNGVTSFADSNSYASIGIKGKGGMDFIIARLNGSTGEPETISAFGTKKGEQSFVVKKGYGDELFFTGQGSFGMPYTETFGKYYTVRTPINTNCNTVYQTKPTFLLIDNFSSPIQCVDSLSRISWSYNNVNNIRILYSTDAGLNFQVLADNLPASVQEYSFDPAARNLTGNTLFKIHDLNDTSLFDTLTFRIQRKPPTPVITASPSENVCGSGPITLTTNAAFCSNCTFRWNNGSTDSSIVVTNSAPYNVTFTNVCGFTFATKTVTINNVVVNIAATADTICLGSNVTLTASGALSYRWSGPNNFTSTNYYIVISPTTVGSFDYTVIGTSNGCSDTASRRIVVRALPPTPVITAVPTAIICNGPGPITLLTNAAACLNCTFKWNNGSTDSNLVVTTSGFYTVTFRNYCSTTQASQQVVIGSPVVTISTSTDSICLGNSISLSANGAFNYSWTGPNLSSNNTAMVTSTPTVTGVANYTVIGSSGGCTDTVTKSILVLPKVTPTLKVLYTGCPTIRISFLANYTNGGSNPSFAWYVNDTLRAQGSPFFTLNSARNGQVVKCIMQSNAYCLTQQTVSQQVVLNCITTDIPDIDGLENYSVSPNPTTGVVFFNLKLARLKNVSFEITDSRGLKVYQQPSTNLIGERTFQVDLSGAAAGMYYLKVRINNDVFVHKVVVAR